jgi:drug/metabolite transporter (DMT)-like permease
MTHTRRLGLLLALVTAGISSVSVFLNTYGVKAVGNATVYTTAKNLVAAVLLGAASLAVGRRSGSRRSGGHARPHGGEWVALAVVGVVGGSVPFVLFFEGLARAGSVQAAFLHKTLVVWVAVLAMLILRERIGWAHVAAIALLVGGQLGFAGGAGFPLDAGAAMILAATLLWAVEVIIAKRLLGRLSSTTVGLARMGLGSVVLVGWVLVRGDGAALVHLTGAQLGWVLLTGALLAGYVATWFAALARAQAVDVTAVLVVGAVGTALLSSAASGVSPAPQAGWMAVVAGGAALVGWSMTRQSPHAIPDPVLPVAATSDPPS